jgi:hypothetical protein
VHATNHHSDAILVPSILIGIASLLSSISIFVALVHKDDKTLEKEGKHKVEDAS